MALSFAFSFPLGRTQPLSLRRCTTAICGLALPRNTMPPAANIGVRAILASSTFLTLTESPLGLLDRQCREDTVKGPLKPSGPGTVSRPCRGQAPDCIIGIPAGERLAPTCIDKESNWTVPRWRTQRSHA